MSRNYLKLIVISNIVMLNLSELLLKFNCKKIPEIIIRQANKNTEYIERSI